MSQKSLDKPFDCLAFKWDAQSRIYEDIKDLSPEEQCAYFRRKAAWFRGRSDVARPVPEGLCENSPVDSSLGQRGHAHHLEVL
ncbi:MAG: hypothetical protein COZ06_00450 [Armatimonadetes bacterium CG_4_10_14_3_um_filter_66_18]|nr:hypothetical protein [Armatimonadota bacterium]OIO92988.1 MAG: hypothetical protein AUJ96_31330 [Armatimonadetes bacterium CG2_30_66_41]PIU91383.1 MAG: hypothetical protein COS65_22175 [Armatimonadetes bacterium CG06_land_8_20_14_3_00_66_21]PIX37735.1 MAG: hypothetical protein COZ57_32845 [Armatimonadetes bacterium CG_4_8_14_3_um_filter_66_20]PIY54168.1 MAG: hypothetical protein COZ06_00450 [Armatimonadetes bacterium CG_4_10_14_3_um_filter_66_18]PIZ43941.1 MAG: hypothetical protein COY42_14